MPNVTRWKNSQLDSGNFSPGDRRRGHCHCHIRLESPEADHQQKVSAELNRPFAIRGDLGIAWQRQRDEPGWRSFIPLPHLHAEDIMLGNPPDIPDVTMIHLQRVDATLAPLALLHKQVFIPWIKLQQSDARLIQTADKKNNWTFTLAESDSKDDNAPPSAWSFRLDNILFDQGTLLYRDAVNKADVTVKLNSLGKPVPFAQIAGGDDSQKGRVTLFSAGRLKGALTMKNSRARVSSAACYHCEARRHRSRCRRMSVTVLHGYSFLAVCRIR